jgi:hypothetical protein
VDHIIITRDDEAEILRSKRFLISKTLEVKDLGQLNYFFCIEIARSTVS